MPGKEAVSRETQSRKRRTFLKIAPKNEHSNASWILCLCLWLFRNMLTKINSCWGDCASLFTVSLVPRSEERREANWTESGDENMHIHLTLPARERERVAWSGYSPFHYCLSIRLSRNIAQIKGNSLQRQPDFLQKLKEHFLNIDFLNLQLTKYCPLLQMSFRFTFWMTISICALCKYILIATVIFISPSLVSDDVLGGVPEKYRGCHNWSGWSLKLVQLLSYITLCQVKSEIFRVPFFILCI